MVPNADIISVKK